MTGRIKKMAKTTKCIPTKKKKARSSPRLTLREREELARPWRQGLKRKTDDQKRKKRSASEESRETQKKRKGVKASSSIKEPITKERRKSVKEEPRSMSPETERPEKRPNRCHFICKGCEEKEKGKNRCWKHRKHDGECGARNA